MRSVECTNCGRVLYEGQSKKCPKCGNPIFKPVVPKEKGSS